MQRGERIVRDLRPRRAHRREERRLAGIRQADDAGIGDQLQAQPDGALLARLAGIGVARRAVGRGLEMRVAEAAIAALRQHDAVADLVEVGEQRLAVLLVDLRADRHLQHDVVAVRAMAVLAHAAAAALGLEVLLVAVVDQGVEAVDRLRDHVAALAAVAAVRAAELDELLAPERHAAVPAVAGADIDLGLVEEFHGARNMGSLPSKKGRWTNAEAPPQRSVYRKTSLNAGNLKELSPGGARVGHASLMRPDRPLPTRLSVICRYAAARTSPRRSSRLEYPGGIAPPVVRGAVLGPHVTCDLRLTIEIVVYAAARLSMIVACHQLFRVPMTGIKTSQ